MGQRKIIHIDMDAFFASVAQLNPMYKGKPVAIGGADSRGVVAAASYEARKFGVYSAMPSKVAKTKCPHLIFVPSDFPLYRKLSAQIRDIFYEYTNLVEPLSLDEAYLDVSVNFVNQPSATLLAQEIRQQIFEKTGLTASAGVSYNKFLAKTASDINKPNGIKVILPDEAFLFMEKLAIEQFYGVGSATAKKFHKYGVCNGKQLKACTLDWLLDNFGKSGHYYYNVVRGIDNRVVNPNRIRKSIGVENTFAENISTIQQMHAQLELLATKLLLRCNKVKKFGRGLTLKIKTADFRLFTRSISLSSLLQQEDDVLAVAKQLLKRLLAEKHGAISVRLMGLSVHSLEQNDVLQQELDLEFNDVVT